MLGLVLVRRLVLAAMVLAGTTACGSHSSASRATATMSAGNKCWAQVDRRFGLQPGPRTIQEATVKDLGHGRLRITGSVPVHRGVHHADSFTCVVVPVASGLRIASFSVNPAA